MSLVKAVGLLLLLVEDSRVRRRLVIHEHIVAGGSIRKAIHGHPAIRIGIQSCVGGWRRRINISRGDVALDLLLGGSGLAGQFASVHQALAELDGAAIVEPWEIIAMS